MGWIHYDYCELVCAIDWSSEHADKYVIVAFVTCFIAPAFTMIFCYSVILKVSVNSEGHLQFLNICPTYFLYCMVMHDEA